MEAIMQSSRENQNILTEDSSDRSDESSTMSQDYQPRGFEAYEIVKRLKGAVGEHRSAKNDFQSLARSKDLLLSMESNVDSNEQHQNIASPFEDNNARELSLSLGKSKKYDYTSVQLSDVMNYQMDRINEAELTTETAQISRTKEPTMKEAFFNLQSVREKYLAGSFERPPKQFNYLVERETKGHGVAKGYDLTVDRINELNSSHERLGENRDNVSPNVERLSGVGILDVRENRNLQSRTQHEIECIVYERLRRPHQHHFLNSMDLTGHNLTNSPQAQQTSVTQTQHSQQHDQQQQQQQQQQIKSFTIDAILAHKNNQRERYQRNQHQQMRKTARASREECQGVTGKNGLRTRRVPDAGLHHVSRIVNSGKAKRVRTIFTAEQLERLEAEFARQQYMVGPERLYLAHALRLTEAQVKVWFQNRRIKWRKVNHERQCQAVSEHRQRCTLPGSLEAQEDESDDANNVNWCVNSAITTSGPSNDASLINAANQHQRDTLDPSIVKS